MRGFSAGKKTVAVSGGSICTGEPALMFPACAEAAEKTIATRQRLNAIAMGPPQSGLDGTLPGGPREGTTGDLRRTAGALALFYCMPPEFVPQRRLHLGAERLVLPAGDAHQERHRDDR